jgi:hypothetical protein
MDDLRVPYNLVIKLVDERLKLNDKAHGRKHINETYTMAIRLTQELGWEINNDVVVLGIVYHDATCHLGRDDHHRTAVEALESDRIELRGLGYTDDEIDHAKDCVLTHRNSWEGSINSLEARMVRAADVGLIFENIDNAVKRGIAFRSEWDMTDEERLTESRRHIALKFNRDRMTCLEPAVYELYKPQWEEMFTLFDGWL